VNGATSSHRISSLDTSAASSESGGRASSPSKYSNSGSKAGAVVVLIFQSSLPLGFDIPTSRHHILYFHQAKKVFQIKCSGCSRRFGQILTSLLNPNNDQFRAHIVELDWSLLCAGYAKLDCRPTRTYQ
jgi:hypothetical protein